MSSFIVSENTISNLAASVVYILDNRNSVTGLPKEELAEAFRDCIFDGKGSVNATARKLFKMNADAVSCRYEEEPAECPIFFPAGKNLLKKMADRPQFLKSLDCYLYQCSEGRIPERRMFIALERLSDVIGHELAKFLPAYERAEWG